MQCHQPAVQPGFRLAVMGCGQRLGRRTLNEYRPCLATLALLLIASSVRADLAIDKPLVNLGEIKGGVPLQHRFELTNHGDQAIEIVEVTASCGCLAPRLEQRSMPAGGKTILVLDLRPLGQPNGPHSWNGLVRYRQGKELRAAVFTVRATVRNEVTVQPTVVALFLEGTVRQEVTVTDVRKAPFKVIQAKASIPGLRVELKALDQGVTKVVLQADGKEMPVGRQDAVVDIFTDDPVYNHFKVPVTLIKSARASVTAAPAKVKLALAAGQKDISALVRLRGQGTVSVAKVESTDPALTCTWATSAEGDTALRVRYRNDPMAKASELHSIRVYLSEPEGTIITIPITIDR